MSCQGNDFLYIGLRAYPFTRNAVVYPTPHQQTGRRLRKDRYFALNFQAGVSACFDSHYLLSWLLYGYEHFITKYSHLLVYCFEKGH